MAYFSFTAGARRKKSHARLFVSVWVPGATYCFHLLRFSSSCHRGLDEVVQFGRGFEALGVCVLFLGGPGCIRSRLGLYSIVVAGCCISRVFFLRGEIGDV